MIHPGLIGAWLGFSVAWAALSRYKEGPLPLWRWATEIVFSPLFCVSGLLYLLGEGPTRLLRIKL